MTPSGPRVEHRSVEVSGMSDQWLSIRKTPEGVHLSLGKDWISGLRAVGFEYRRTGPFHLRFDLNRYLPAHPRSKPLDTQQQDARDLADGRMVEVSSVEIQYQRLCRQIIERAQRMEQAGGLWTLTVRLGRDWTCRVVPAERAGGLVLQVREPMLATGPER